MRDIKEESEILYEKLQNESGLKVGDIVRVLRKAAYHEYGWPEAWVPGRKDKFIDPDKTFKIRRIDSTGIVLRYNEDDIGWHFPFFVLEKVKAAFAPYHIGQRFLYNNQDEYILARIDRNTVNLICLRSGGRWSGNKKVNDDQKITEEEMKLLADTLGQWSGFKLKE